jgi:enoyl-CoA hydratase
MMSDEIQLAKDGAVAVVTLNAVHRRNALSPAMAAELSAVCDEIDSDKTIGAAVIRGAGGHFCSGADRAVLKASEANPANEQSYADNSAVYGAFYHFGHLQCPTVAAVQGASVGAGMNLLLAADVRVIAEDARLISGFLRIGIHPGGGHFSLMSRLAGPQTAAAMSVFGVELSGADALRVGIAWEAPPADKVDERAMAIAQGAAHDPELARLAVASLRSIAGPPATSWEVALQAERAPQMWSLRRRGQASA